jgi:hypothetical protein
MTAVRSGLGRLGSLHAFWGCSRRRDYVREAQLSRAERERYLLGLGLGCGFRKQDQDQVQLGRSAGGCRRLAGATSSARLDEFSFSCLSADDGGSGVVRWGQRDGGSLLGISVPASKQWCGVAVRAEASVSRNGWPSCCFLLPVGGSEKLGLDGRWFGRATLLSAATEQSRCDAGGRWGTLGSPERAPLSDGTLWHRVSRSRR